MVNSEFPMAEHQDDWARVRAALANPDWDFRTVDGIARETRLPREHVERLLQGHGTAVRRAVSRRWRARGWQFVYTLRSRPTRFRARFREVVDNILTFAGQ